MALKAKTSVEKEITPSKDTELLTLLREMQAKINKLEAENKKNQKEKKVQSSPVVAGSQSRYIDIISLYPDLLILKTGEETNSKRWQLKGFGYKQRLLSSEVHDVVNNQNQYARDGYFYIKDSQFVDEEGLREDYNHILTKDQILSIIDSKNADDIPELWNIATSTQHAIIVDLMVRKLIKGNDYDPRVVSKVEELANAEVRKLNRGSSKEDAKFFPKVDIVERARSSKGYDQFGNSTESVEDEE